MGSYIYFPFGRNTTAKGGGGLGLQKQNYGAITWTERTIKQTRAEIWNAILFTIHANY